MHVLFTHPQRFAHTFLYKLFYNFAGAGAQRLYEEAMTKGVVKVALAVLIFMGITGSGKRLFKRLVLNLDVPESSDSTKLLDSSGRPISISQIGVESEEWNEISYEGMMDRVAAGIKNRTISVVPQPSSNNLTSETVSLPESESILEPVEETDSGQRNITQQDKFTPSFITAMREIKLDDQLLLKMSFVPENSEDMNVDFLYMLDSGGQPPFREMLPHLIQPSVQKSADDIQYSTAVVLMQKLNERLDFRPTILYRENGVEDDEGYISHLTNEQILYQYIQALQSHNTTVFVVGTHKDLEHLCESETRTEKNEKLLNAFQSVLADNVSLYRPDELMYPVDSTKRTEEEMQVAKSFRKAVKEKCMQKRVPVPLPWFLLAQLLQLLAEKMKVQVLSIKECCEAANTNLHIPENECLAAIEFLAKLNILFYRRDILPDVVFCNAQVVLVKMTDLVRCNHRMRTSKTSQNIEKCMQSVKGVKFRDCGLVDEQLLKAFTSHYRTGLFEVSHFLKLLEGLLIASKLRNGKYFIPSVLAHTEKEDYRQASTTRPEPIIVFYPNMWLPIGLVPSLVAYLQNHCHWSPLMQGGEPVYMYHNCMQFELPGGMAGSVTLIDSIKFLEIHVMASFTIANNICSDIREVIEYALKEAHKSLHYKTPLTAKIGVLCSSSKCGNSESHSATVDRIENSWRCNTSTEQTIKGDLTDGQKLWFREG